MKNYILKFAIIALTFAFFLSGCSKSMDTDHSIRIKNEYAETINNLKVGPANYGNVNSGSLTGYVHVTEGANVLSGSTPSGASISGTVTVSGKGTHKWTLTIQSTGTVIIKED
jgi:hypothetical protein